MLFRSGAAINRLERHSNDCASRREIENIYGRYKMFDLASSYSNSKLPTGQFRRAHG